MRVSSIFSFPRPGPSSSLPRLPEQSSRSTRSSWHDKLVDQSLRAPTLYVLNRNLLVHSLLLTIVYRTGMRTK